MAIQLITTRTKTVRTMEGIESRKKSHNILAFLVCFLMGRKVALEGKLHTALAFDGLTAQLLMISQVDLDIELLPTLSASMALLAIVVLPTKVSSELVQPNERLTTQWAPGRDLLVMARALGSIVGGRIDGRAAFTLELADIGPRVMCLEVHLHGLLHR